MVMQLTDVSSDDRAEDSESPGYELYSVLDQLARSMRVRSDELQPTLDAIVRAAVHTVPGTDDAGLIIVRRGVLTPVATTGERPAVLDELQRKVKNGPCYEAAASREIVIINDLTNDVRWPAMHEAAAELGIAGMVCVPLLLDSRTTGTLSLYSSRRGAFDVADLKFTELFATLAALALGEAQRVEQLNEALINRDVLGQAKGILMERGRIGADAAFAQLVAASQATNEKVAVVAQHLVATGELLEPGRRPRG